MLFYDVDQTFIASVDVGPTPKMLAFSPDGSRLVVANKGKASGYELGDIDPLGSLSIIDLSGDPFALGPEHVSTAGFGTLDPRRVDPQVRVVGPGASFAQDMEPEHVVVTADGSTAVVTLQPNNALALVDIPSASVTAVLPCGSTDHSVVPLDPSDDDGAIAIATWPVRGMRQPDGVASFEVEGETYFITANEGSARGFESRRTRALTLDPTAFPDPSLQDDEQLGRLVVSDLEGIADDSGTEPIYDTLYAFGSRSISIFDAAGELLWDSGDAIEQAVAVAHPANFNSNDTSNDTFDRRSDDSGPEPESVTTGTVFGTLYAFVTLEQMGGVMVWDLSDPTQPELVLFVNPRDYDEDPDEGEADDLSPEDIVFVEAEDSPTNEALVMVTNEGSGTVSIYALSLGPV